MTVFWKRAAPKGFEHLRLKLKSLGVDEAVGEKFVSRISCFADSHRSQDIITPGTSPNRLTVLMEGVACLYERLADGTRQIFGFLYAGDFCLNRHLLPTTGDEVAVEAITKCSVGFIEHRVLEELLAEYPSLGMALWRAHILEASISRKRLLNIGRQPALERVAHLLCEQLALQEAVGINSAAIPLNQIDIADASGLSVVHVNRTFKELQRLGLLVKEGRTMEVADRERLALLGAFDGNYLNMPQLLSRWQINMDRPAPAPKRALS